ncbi:MAG: hypothetical protein WDW36_003088 [Sanguina aurantia]
MTPQAKPRPPKVRSRVETPVSTTTHWFYQQGEVIRGPAPLSVLLQGLRSHTLSENTVVYHPWSDAMLLGRVVHGVEFYRAQGAPQLTTPPDYDVIAVALQAEAAQWGPLHLHGPFCHAATPAPGPAQTHSRATAPQVTAPGRRAADHGLPPLTGLPKPPPQQQQQQQTAPPMQGPGNRRCPERRLSPPNRARCSVAEWQARRSFALMVRRSQARGEVIVWRGPGEYLVDPDIVLVYSARGTIITPAHDVLETGDAWLAPAAGSSAILAADGIALAIRVTALA